MRLAFMSLGIIFLLVGCTNNDVAQPKDSIEDTNSSTETKSDISELKVQLVENQKQIKELQE
ncbi:hypothetical protein ACLIA0_14480 [Bacillaceae bacterium W0354]